MSTDLFDGPGAKIPRDRWGRPLVTPPGGKKPVGYTRCTTFVDCLDDKFNLQKWQQRMVATGLADRPDLLLAVAAHRGDKQELNQITAKALEAAQAGAAATTGTALHALTERIDRGEDLPVIPEAYRADLEAYRRATGALESLLIEQFTVLDDLRVGGTPDRVVRYRDKLYIADVKTGSVDFGAMKIAMQLAVYSRSTPYNHETKERTPYPGEVDTTRGIVIHLPAGTGTCELRWVDLEVGWNAVDTASRVRYWRSYKDWYQPFEQVNPDVGTSFDPVPDFTAEVAAASSADELRQVWKRADAANAYTPQLHAACLARKAELEAAA